MHYLSSIPICLLPLQFLITVSQLSHLANTLAIRDDPQKTPEEGVPPNAPSVIFDGDKDEYVRLLAQRNGGDMDYVSYDLVEYEGVCESGQTLKFETSEHKYYLGGLLGEHHNKKVSNSVECIQKCMEHARCQSVNLVWPDPMSMDNSAFATCELLIDSQTNNPGLMVDRTTSQHLYNMHCEGDVEMSDFTTTSTVVTTRVFPTKPQQVTEKTTKYSLKTLFLKQLIEKLYRFQVPQALRRRLRQL